MKYGISLTPVGTHESDPFEYLRCEYCGGKFIEEKYNQAIVVLTALVAFQEIYEKRTRDVLPFNDFYRERIMRIINAARNIIKE